MNGMDWTSPDWAYALAAALVLALLFVLVKSANIGKYQARPLMTGNELEFYFRITRALPNHLVFPQVSLQALIEPASNDAKKANADRLRIAQQRADYVVCDPAGAVVVVIELDDKTHERKRDAVRDARLKQGGLKTLRYQSKAKPSIAVIRRDVLEHSDTGHSKARDLP